MMSRTSSPPLNNAERLILLAFWRAVLGHGPTFGPTAVLLWQLLRVRAAGKRRGVFGRYHGGNPARGERAYGLDMASSDVLDLKPWRRKES